MTTQLPDSPPSLWLDAFGRYTPEPIRAYLQLEDWWYERELK